ncbi:MAG: four helix bundle protein [Patescibacteria group bacterium]
MASTTGTASIIGIGPGEGYKKLIVWQNADRLRREIYVITGRFKPIEFRRVTQLRDCIRSVKQNMQEGYKCGSLGGYIRYLNISLGSLGEAKGDIDDCYQDGLISEDEFKELDKLCGTTDFLLKKMLKSMHEAGKNGTWKNFNA